MRIILSAAAAAILLSGCVDTQTGEIVPASARTGGIHSAYDAVKREDYAAAEKQLTDVLAKNPNEPYANLTMGYVLHSTDRAPLARPYYERAATHGESALLDRYYMLGDQEHPISNISERTVSELARRNMASLDGAS